MQVIQPAESAVVPHGDEFMTWRHGVHDVEIGDLYARRIMLNCCGYKGCEDVAVD